MNKIIAALILLISISLLFGCTSSEDLAKNYPQVKGFLEQHPNAKMTLTDYSTTDFEKDATFWNTNCTSNISAQSYYKLELVDTTETFKAIFDKSNMAFLCGFTVPTINANEPPANNPSNPQSNPTGNNTPPINNNPPANIPPTDDNSIVDNTPRITQETAARNTWKSGSPWGISDWAYADGTLTLILVNNSSDTLGLNKVTIATPTTGDIQTYDFLCKQLNTNSLVCGCYLKDTSKGELNSAGNYVVAGPNTCPNSLKEDLKTQAIFNWEGNGQLSTTVSTRMVPPSGGTTAVKIPIIYSGTDCLVLEKRTISIDYNSPSISNKTQGGTANIILNCPNLYITQNVAETKVATIKATWKSGSPWGISDWAYADGTLTLILVNNSSDTLELNNVAITGATFMSKSVSTVPPSGGTSTVKMAITCTSGTKAAFKKADISIDYNSPSIDNKTQSGAADIIVTCQSDLGLQPNQETQNQKLACLADCNFVGTDCGTIDAPKGCAALQPNHCTSSGAPTNNCIIK